MTDKSYVGKGKVYVDGIAVGNVSALALAIAEEKVELKNYMTAGGGTLNSFSRITGVTASITLTEYSKENLALATRGASSAVTATTVTDESIDAPATLTVDTLVRTAFVIDTTVAPVVTSDPAGTTYVEDTDYTVSPAGITILAAGSINASDPLLVDYTKKAVDVVEALTASGAEYQVVLDGLNEAQSGTAVVVDMHRVKFGPAADLSLIGDEFAELVLSADVLADTTITTSGLSQYLKISQA